MYHVLVPIDADGERAAAQADAVRRLPGEDDDVRVTVLRVFEDGADSLTDPADTDAGANLLATLSERGMRVDTAARVGDPTAEILSTAEEIGADVIVLGGRKRSPLGTLLFGSVSQSVMLQADRPVTITGADVKRDPSHRCESCGETYYVDPATDITTCRRCGGTSVEPVEVVVR